jgi:hypothetical protein
MSTVTHRLGAIELIELGKTYSNDVAPVLRRPFLANPLPKLAGPQLGIDFASIGSFLTGAFEFLFSTLADIVSVPLDLASSGVGLLFDGLAGILVNVPIIGVLASQILLLGKAVIQWGLSVPGLLLEGVGNIFGEIKGAIDATRTDDEKKSDETEATKKILDKAEEKGGPTFKSAVEDAITGKDPSDTTGTPDKRPDSDLPAGADEVGTPGKTGIEKALEVGLPVAGAATLVFLAVS